MNFPAGVDPSTYALPVFLIEPTDAFAAKGRPAVGFLNPLLYKLLLAGHTAVRARAANSHLNNNNVS